MSKATAKKSLPNQTVDPTSDWTVDELKAAVRKGKESGVSRVSNLAQYRAEFARKKR